MALGLPLDKAVTQHSTAFGFRRTTTLNYKDGHQYIIFTKKTPGKIGEKQDTLKHVFLFECPKSGVQCSPNLRHVNAEHYVQLITGLLYLLLPTLFKYKTWI